MQEHVQNEPRDIPPEIIEEAAEILRCEVKLNSTINDLARAGDRKELLDALLEYVYDRRAEQRGCLTKSAPAH